MSLTSPIQRRGCSSDGLTRMLPATRDTEWTLACMQSQYWARHLGGPQMQARPVWGHEAYTTSADDNQRTSPASLRAPGKLNRPAPPARLVRSGPTANHNQSCRLLLAPRRVHVESSCRSARGATSADVFLARSRPRVVEPPAPVRSTFCARLSAAAREMDVACDRLKRSFRTLTLVFDGDLTATLVSNNWIDRTDAVGHLNGDAGPLSGVAGDRGEAAYNGPYGRFHETPRG